MGITKFLRRKSASQKLLLIGLDCADPELVFHRWSNDLPNLKFLMDNGIWGKLRSCIPAITVPAWSCMLSGKDPGELGIYGFRNRADHTYDKMFLATGADVRAKRVWDYLSDLGKTSVVIGVPQTYPVRPLQGSLISGFLAPSLDSEFTFPPELKQTILNLAPDYQFDVRKFRTEDKDWLLTQIRDMTEKRFRVVDHLLSTADWDFFMLMEIGVDRIHHGFWSYSDPGHRRYLEGNTYENAIHDYYVYLDERIGGLIENLEDDVAIMVVSDHGAKRMDGGICVNEWLWREGYLTFNRDPEVGKITPFDKMDVDWSRTKAWGLGGYYGRIFLNVINREPQGIVPPEQADNLKDELISKLESIRDPVGRALGTRVFRPERIYREVNGVAPDLMVYFGDLYWRSVGSLGHGGCHTYENDIGPDDCNHAEDGIFILYDPLGDRRNLYVEGAQLLGVTSTIFEVMGIKKPDNLKEPSILSHLNS